MIKAIHGGDLIHVTGPSYSMPYIDSTKPSAGLMRYKDYTIEVYDGNSWVSAVASAPTIDLSNDVKSIISWAKQKMIEEETIKKLAESHPAIQAAYDNLKKAEDQLKTTIILSKDECQNCQLT